MSPTNSYTNIQALETVYGHGFKETVKGDWSYSIVGTVFALYSMKPIQTKSLSIIWNGP